MFHPASCNTIVTIKDDLGTATVETNKRKQVSLPSSILSKGVS